MDTPQGGGAAVRRRAVYAAVTLLSATGIAYQIALMRILSIAQWHHFAYMIISIAMLGFGASGTLLAMLHPRIAGREAVLLRVSALGVALSFSCCYIISQRIPFETFELLNQPGQFWRLLALYALLSLPFFLVASSITIGFLLYPRDIGRIYFFNMAGSGAGALGAMGLLYLVSPAVLPAFLSLCASLACVLLSPVQKGLRLGPVLALALSGLAAAAAWNTPVRVSQYKGLSYALQYPDARILARACSPLSEITAVESEYIRETPGQLSNYPMSELGSLPAQVGLYFDAGGVSAVHQYDGSLDAFAYFDYVTGALPFHLVEHPRTLVLGSGGGGEVINALVHGASRVTAVEADPGVLQLLRGPLKTFSGGLFEQPDVDVVLAEGRGHLEASSACYDLIQLPVAGSFTAASAGVLALNESYLYTTEAMALYLERLTPRGVLAVNCWLQMPPREAIKLFATLAEACERLGLAPERHMAFIRSWNSAAITVTRAPMGPEQIEAVRRFCADRFFDPCYYPGIKPAEANRYTVLDEPYYFDAAHAILAGDRETFYRNYFFHIRPATDDQPYFFRFLRWHSLPMLWEQGPEGVPVVEWGYLVLMATVAQGALLGAVLILLPLAVLARRSAATIGKGPLFAYFAGLGFAYMFLEIAFIQIFMRFLAYPVYAVTVVLTAFLAFSGCGSLWSGTLEDDRRIRAVRSAAAAIALLAVACLLLLPPFFRVAAGWGDPAKIAASIMLLAPLAFCMGIPFPAGLQLVSDRAPGLLPWAWGINGCTSVMGAALATLIAVHVGFRGLVLSALIFYVLAAWMMGSMHQRRTGGNSQSC